MRTPSGVLHIIDFKTSQIVSAIQPKDYWDDKRHWEIKNNIDTLEFKVFDNTDHATTLVQQNLVLKEVRDGRIVPYVITETEKNSDDRSVIAYASGEWIQLAKSGIINPQKIVGKTVNEFIDMALVGTKWKRGKTEYAGFHTMTIDEFIDPLKFLKDIASLFELEIQYRAEVVGSQIVGRYVDMVKKRGRDTGKEVTLGKDLIGIKRIENSQNICTALLGFVKKEGGDFITISTINNGVPYLVDSDAFQRWNERGQHKFGFYTPETEEDITPQRLLTLMKTELAKRINTSYIYEVQAQSIGRVFGLAHELINEGDTIRIKDTGFTPKLYLEARAIAGDESHTDPSQDKYTFGDYREIVDANEELRKLYNKVLASLGSKQEILNQLDKLVKETAEKANDAQKESESAKKLAEKVQENLKNNTVSIIEAKNPPIDNLIVGKTIWRDISNGKPGILKVWNGKGWELLIPDVESVKKDTLEQVNKDIESTKTELNEKVQGVEKKAQDIAGQIVDVQKQVNGKVDQTWIDSQLKDKVDKTGVYTKDEIKDGFIGKQIYETDKNGNIKKFQDMNTSISQTNEALKQKAEKSELTKANDGLTKLQNKTNEIETTANGTKQKLSELETTVNNTNVGGRNYVLDSDKFISPPNTIQSFQFVNDLKDLQGKQVTLSVYVEIKNAKIGVNLSNRVGFEPSIRYSDNSIQHLGAWLRITDGMNFKGIISTTVSIKDIEVLKTEQNAVYIQCGGDYVKVGRPKIEIGNKVTDWTPAPEDNVSNTDFTKKTVEIETTIKGINTTVSNVQREQGKLTERMTKSEQTADGFKTSIESLTKKDNDISNKLNTVEQTVEGTKKTIIDVQQTTNDLKKTTTEITEKAGQISEKLESVEKKVNNDKAGGRNLLLDSNARYEKTDYLISQYSLTENFSTGEEYTFVIKGSIPAGQKFGIWMNGGSSNVGYATSVYANGITYVTFKAVAATSGNERKLSLYNFPSNTTKSDVEWVALYKGNRPQDWTPAPENQVTNDEFTKKTTEIEKSVDGIKESIKTVEKTQTFFTERVNTVEKNAEGTTASVKKLQEIQTEQGKTLTQATTTIQQHSEALKLTMQKKDVEDYVGGLGTVNELRDADFKLGQKYWFWNSGNGATGSVDTNLKYKGMNTFSITVTDQTQDRWWGLTSQFIECQVNEDFVASGYFNTDGKTPIDSGGAFIEIEWWTADKKTRIKTARTNIKVVNHTWVRAVCADKAPANASFVRWRYYVTRNGRLWCAAPMLQRGTVATEFWLHPKDQTDVDKMIEDIANRVATKDYDKKVTELERSISANEKGVSIISGKQETFINETYNAYVKKTESRLEVLDEGIIAQILKDGIVTAINMSPGKITINAAKLDINADTMVKWLTAKGIDTNLIRINGDKITIDKDGVTVKMLDFLFQDEWGTKTTAVSRRNLIADSDFSSVTKKNIGHSDYYGFEGGYGLTWKSWGNVVIEKNTHIFDYEQMVNAARVDMYNYPEAIVNNGIHPGNEYTVSAHFRTAMINGVRKTGKPRLHVCCVTFRDNVSYDIWNEQKMDFPEPSTFYGEIRRYSFTFKVPTNYIPQQHALIIKVCSGNADMRQGTAICVSGVTLYSGKYASMYNWDRAAAERADGIQPFNALAVGGVNNNISPAPDGQTFDISTEKEVKIFRNIRAMQGVNLGGGGFQQWGHIRFTDGNAGAGFYTSTPSGWKFNALG
ncbi:phage minor structural protein [Bacillus cereus BAG3X2-2]|uniref:phage tail spike protein n=1 Tax=Bacillus cereus TaxID=1396 RepID=UPI0002792EC3|nr:phage tail spike protein [Bacillus cereus]EJQ19476.1 phage minor structural protein [Bacillus cereus BAG3X2-2]